MVQKCERPRNLQEVRDLIALRQVDVAPKAEKVLRFAFEHPADTAFSTMSHLASQCRVSNATVMRLSRCFGFESFRDFRELFRLEIRRAGTRRRNE